MIGEAFVGPRVSFRSGCACVFLFILYRYLSSLSCGPSFFAGRLRLGVGRVCADFKSELPLPRIAAVARRPRSLLSAPTRKQPTAAERPDGATAAEPLGVGNRRRAS